MQHNKHDIVHSKITIVRVPLVLSSCVVPPGVTTQLQVTGSGGTALQLKLLNLQLISKVAFTVYKQLVVHHRNRIMISSHFSYHEYSSWIFRPTMWCPQCQQILQDYYAVTVIVILLCMH